MEEADIVIDPNPDIRPLIPLAVSPDIAHSEEQHAIPDGAEGSDGELKIKALVMNCTNESMYVLLPNDNCPDRTVIVRPNHLYYWKEQN